MKALNLTIKLRRGLGELSFGQGIDDVVAYLGEPTEIETLPMEDDTTTTVLNYDEIGLGLFFEGAGQPKLSCIETDNPETVLFGEKIFEMKQEDLVEFVKKEGLCVMDAEEEAWGEYRVTFEDAMIDFYFDKGELTVVNWGKDID